MLQAESYSKQYLSFILPPFRLLKTFLFPEQLWLLTPTLFCLCKLTVCKVHFVLNHLFVLFWNLIAS